MIVQPYVYSVLPMEALGAQYAGNNFTFCGGKSF